VSKFVGDRALRDLFSIIGVVFLAGCEGSTVGVGRHDHVEISIGRRPGQAAQRTIEMSKAVTKQPIVTRIPAIP